MHACDGRTDGQTDGQTDRILLAIPRLHYMQRGKNQVLVEAVRIRVYVLQMIHHCITCIHDIRNKCKQDAQLSQRDRAAGCVIVFVKSRRLELGDNILRTLCTVI